MTAHAHAILWIDHHLAKVIFFNANEGDEVTMHADLPPSHIHSKAGSASGTHLHGDPDYFAEIAETLAPARTFLVVGPSTAREQFVSYLKDHQPAAIAHLAGIEPLDKESDGQLLAFARVWFRRQDRMTPQR